MTKQDTIEDTDITFEIRINSILKLDQKQAVIQGLTNYLKDEDIQNTRLQGTCYYDRRSAEAGQVIAISLTVTAAVLSIVSSCWNILRNLGQEKIKATVFVKRKDGLYVKITEDMSKEEVINQLQKDDDVK